MIDFKPDMTVRTYTTIRKQRKDCRNCSSEDGIDHVAIDIRETIIAAVVTIREPRVVETHEVQDGGVQVVDVNFVLNSVPAEVVGRAMHHAAFHAAARHPHGE